MRKSYSDEEVREWHEKYIELKSVTKVGDLFGIGFQTVAQQFNRRGLYVAKCGSAKVYTCNEDFFSQDTPESFYWAGFIAADGCLIMSKGKYKTIRIELAEKDWAHLEKIKVATNYTGDIKHYSNGKESVMIYFRSAKMFDDLARFNITTKKSLTLRFPDWITDHPMANHFMRGFFDGDGSVSTRRRENRIEQLNLSWVGTFDFIDSYIDIISKRCQINKSILRRHHSTDGIYTASYEGNRKCLRIRDFLYEGSDSSIVLDRKFDLLHSEFIISIPENFRHKVVVGTNIQTKQARRFVSLKETEQFGFQSASVSSCCNERRKSHLGHTWKFEENQ